MTELARTIDQAVKSMTGREGSYLNFALPERSFKMNLLFYSSKSDERSKKIYGRLENSSHNVLLELHHSKGSLVSRLRQPLHGIALMVLYLAEKRDLSDLCAIRELFNDIPLIIIMNDTKGVTMTKALLLRPLMIFNPNDNLENICPVFEKMMADKSVININ